MRWIAMLGAACALTACQSPSTVQDDTADGDTDTDADADTDTDTDTDDHVEVPLPGWGEITGTCGALNRSVWEDDAPRYLYNDLELTGTYDVSLLSEGGQEVIEDGNLGGSSLESEAMSFELLYRCELAILLATEGEVDYSHDGGKKTDLVVDIDGRRIGVSVTRAVRWPHGEPYTYAMAHDLLWDKLSDIPLSSRNVRDTEAWERQILYVLAWDDQHAELIAEAWYAEDMPRGDTIVMVTTTDGDDGFIYE